MHVRSTEYLRVFGTSIPLLSVIPSCLLKRGVINHHNYCVYLLVLLLSSPSIDLTIRGYLFVLVTKVHRQRDSRGSRATAASKPTPASIYSRHPPSFQRPPRTSPRPAPIVIIGILARPSSLSLSLFLPQLYPHPQAVPAFDESAVALFVTPHQHWAAQTRHRSAIRPSRSVFPPSHLSWPLHRFPPPLLSSRLPSASFFLLFPSPWTLPRLAS